MIDRLSKKPGRVELAYDDGTKVQVTITRKDEPVVTGSAYNKSNVLPDDVCAALGLDSAVAEPKDALLVSKDIGRVKTENGFYDGKSPAIQGIILDTRITLPYTNMRFTHHFKRCVCMNNTEGVICVVDTDTWSTLVSIPKDRSLPYNSDAISYATDTYIVIASTGYYSSNEMSFRIYRYTDRDITLVTKKSISGITYNGDGNCTSQNIPDGRYLYMFATCNAKGAFACRYVFDTQTASFVVEERGWVPSGESRIHVDFVITDDNDCWAGVSKNVEAEGTILYKLHASGSVKLHTIAKEYIGTIFYDSKTSLIFWKSDTTYKYNATNDLLISSSLIGWKIVKDGFLYGDNKVYNSDLLDVSAKVPNITVYAESMCTQTDSSYARGFPVSGGSTIFIEELGLLFNLDGGDKANTMLGRGHIECLMGYERHVY